MISKINKFSLLFSLLFLIFSSFGFAQLNITVVDELQKPIPNVTIIDENNRVYTFTDPNGEITIPKYANYHLSISQIGYEPIMWVNNVESIDSNIVIQLKPIVNHLDEYVFSSQKWDKRNKKTKKAGYFQRKSLSKMMFRTKAKYGVLIENIPQTEKIRVLRSVNFRLEKVKKIKKAPNGYVIEIKIFEMIHGKPAATALNTKPIFINAEDFKKKNQIMISETITIPDEGLFVSLEFPDYEGTEHIIINRVKTKNDPVSYVCSGTKEWHTNFERSRFFNHQVQQMGLPEKLMKASKMNFNIGITYYE